MDKITEIVEGTKGGWNKIDTKKRATMVVLIIAIILIVSILTFYNQKVNYATLYRNLEPQDAGNIVADLTAKKIKYKLENSSKDILIDETVIGEYRLQLAMEGMMPNNSSGFEIFDEMGLMVTDEDRKIMYQRALTGELQRSIMSLDVVNAAKVHLMIPEKTIFETQRSEASASVIIDLKPNQNVSDEMIRGIAALISGAVDNMQESNIKIIDSKGNLLSSVLQAKDNFNALDVMNTYQKVIDEFEAKIENNIYNLLGSAYGRDKIKVSVFADLDFDSEESTMITYENPVVRSDQVSASGGNLNVQQITGGKIDDNLSSVIDSESGNGSTYERIINNELSTETKSKIKAPGKVNKLTTSILYDGDLTEANITKIQNIVATATGYDMDRGDLISVEGVVFDKSYEQKLQAELDAIKLAEENNLSSNKYGDYIKWGLRSLGIIMLLTLIFLILSKKRKNTKEDNIFKEQMALNTSTGQLIDIVDDNIEIRADSKGAKAKKYAKENPEMAADLIKAWLKD